MSYYLHNLFPDLYYEPTYDTLVLSSGSVKGFIMLGALQFCHDNGLLKHVTTFVGTSVGSIISYLLCIGYSPSEILAHIHVKNWMDKMKDIELSHFIEEKSLSTYIYIQDALERMTREKVGKYLTLKELKDNFNKNLYVCTYNMTLSRTEFLSHETHPDLPCLVALRMSSNIPILFDRFKYTDNFYVDGAICNHFPIKFGLLHGKNVLGLNLLTKTKDEPDRGIFNYIFKLFHIPMIEQAKKDIEEIKENNDRVIDIINVDSDYKEHSFIDFTFNVSKHDMTNMFTYGYKQIKHHIQRSS